MFISTNVNCNHGDDFSCKRAKHKSGKGKRKGEKKGGIKIEFFTLFIFYYKEKGKSQVSSVQLSTDINEGEGERKQLHMQ